MTIMLSQLFFFHKYLNWSNKFTKFLGEAAYAVYLLHSHIVIIMCYVYTLIVEAVMTRGSVWQLHSSAIDGTFVAASVDGAPAATRSLLIETPEHEAVAWLGFLFVLITSNVIVWPLSYCIAKLPLFNRVL